MSVMSDLRGSNIGPDVKMKTLVLGRRQVEELLGMAEALLAVEDALRLKAQGKTVMPPKIYLDLPAYHGDFRAMPAYIKGMAGVKWVSSYPENTRVGLPSVWATIILCDPRTSFPLAIMDGTYITNMRTGAAGGVAVKYMARKNSKTVGIIGAGRQAETQLLAILEVLTGIENVKVFDKYHEASQRYIERMGRHLSVKMGLAKTLAEAADADIVVTSTPAREPIVKKEYIRLGTHINAIGADAAGKQELDSDLIACAKVIVDDMEQAAHSGEINVPLAQGRITSADIYGDLGEIIIQAKKGRENEEEVTIFDSTGLAIQDIICAQYVYEKVKGKEIASFDLI